MEGAIDIATLLLDKGVEVDPKSSSGETPLMFAAWMDHPQLVHILLAKGAAIDARTSEGETALILALRHHRNPSLEVVRELVERGADVNAKDNFGFSVLWMAMGHRLEVVKYLLSHGADPNTQGVLFMDAWDSRRREILKALLAKGADPNVKDEKGRTALSLAAWSHHETAQLLIEAGAGPCEKRDREGMLISAASVGDTRFVETLLDEHVDVNAVSDRGKSALMAAAMEGHEDAVRLLLARGAEVNARAPQGTTALMLAIGAGHLGTVQILVSKRAKLNSKAARNFNRDTVMLLPLTLSEMNNHKEIAAFLRKKGAREEAELQQTPRPTRNSHHLHKITSD